MVQHATTVLVVAALAFILLRLCYRRIQDTGLHKLWQLAGVLPFWLCCREITDGALSCIELKLLLASWPEYTLQPPVFLAAALALTAVIGLIPGSSSRNDGGSPTGAKADPFAVTPASLGARP